MSHLASWLPQLLQLTMSCPFCPVCSLCRGSNLCLLPHLYCRLSTLLGLCGDDNVLLWCSVCSYILQKETTLARVSSLSRNKIFLILSSFMPQTSLSWMSSSCSVPKLQLLALILRSVTYVYLGTKDVLKFPFQTFRVLF